jgi:hypothetical protein
MNAASIKMLVTTPRFGVTEAMEEALPECPTVEKLVVFGGKVPNDKWIDFDAEWEASPDTPVVKNNIKSDMMDERENKSHLDNFIGSQSDTSSRHTLA